jgi:hypothetical protein
MAANNLPICPNVVRCKSTEVTTALTSRAKITGTTGLTLLLAAGANGTRVDQIVAQMEATSAAAIIYVWIYDGTTAFLFDEIPIAAITGSATVAGAQATKNYSNLVIPSGYSIYVSTTVTQNTAVHGFGGDY